MNDQVYVLMISYKPEGETSNIRFFKGVYGTRVRYTPDVLDAHRFGKLESIEPVLELVTRDHQFGTEDGYILTGYKSMDEVQIKPMILTYTLTPVDPVGKRDPFFKHLMMDVEEM